MVNKVENVSLGSLVGWWRWFYCCSRLLCSLQSGLPTSGRQAPPPWHLPGLEKSPASSWYTKPALIKVPLILFCEVVMLHLETFSGPKYTPFNTRINLVNTGINTRNKLCGHRGQQRQSQYSFLLSCSLWGTPSFMKTVCATLCLSSLSAHTTECVCVKPGGWRRLVSILLFAIVLHLRPLFPQIVYFACVFQCRIQPAFQFPQNNSLTPKLVSRAGLTEYFKGKMKPCFYIKPPHCAQLTNASWPHLCLSRSHFSSPSLTWHSTLPLAFQLPVSQTQQLSGLSSARVFLK